MQNSIPLTLLAGAMSLTASLAIAQGLNLPDQVTLFQNVKVFDGVNEGLQDLDVLIVGNKIHRVGPDIPEVGTWEVEAKTQEATRLPAAPGDYSGGYSFRVQNDSGESETVEVEVNIIDGGGRTLMPGLIESHVHLNLQHMLGGYDTLEHRDWQEIGAMAAFTA